MKKYNIKSMYFMLLFATGVVMGMEEEHSPKTIYLKNELSPIKKGSDYTLDYTLVCVINDIDDRSQPDYTKYVLYGEKIKLGPSDEIKTLKIRLSGTGSEKGIYTYDYLTDELKKQIEEKASDKNASDLTIIVKHYYKYMPFIGKVWIPKVYQYDWEWSKPEQAQAKPIIETPFKELPLEEESKANEESWLTQGIFLEPSNFNSPQPEPQTKPTGGLITLSKIIQGALGNDYMKKVSDICNADYTKAEEKKVSNLCADLKTMFVKKGISGAVSEEDAKRIIDGIHARLQMYRILRYF